MIHLPTKIVKTIPLISEVNLPLNTAQIVTAMCNMLTVASDIHNCPLDPMWNWRFEPSHDDSYCFSGIIYESPSKHLISTNPATPTPDEKRRGSFQVIKSPNSTEIEISLDVSIPIHEVQLRNLVLGSDKNLMFITATVDQCYHQLDVGYLIADMIRKWERELKLEGKQFDIRISGAFNFEQGVPLSQYPKGNIDVSLDHTYTERFDGNYSIIPRSEDFLIVICLNVGDKVEEWKKLGEKRIEA